MKSTAIFYLDKKASELRDRQSVCISAIEELEKEFSFLEEKEKRLEKEVSEMKQACSFVQETDIAEPVIRGLFRELEELLNKQKILANNKAEIKDYAARNAKSLSEIETELNEIEYAKEQLERR